MDIRTGFSRALREIRTSKGLTQEDFSDVSSRTYLSSLERAAKAPTIEKIDAIAKKMGIHPLSLLTLSYERSDDSKLEQLFATVRNDLSGLPNHD